MRPATFDPSVLRQHLRRHKIADLPELKHVLGTDIADAFTRCRKLPALMIMASGLTKRSGSTDTAPC